MKRITVDEATASQLAKLMVQRYLLRQKELAIPFEEWMLGMRIEDAIQMQVIAFQPWPHLVDRAIVWGQGTSEDVLKSRQLGISWLECGLAVWKARHKGANVLLISQGEREAWEMLRKCKVIAENHKRPVKLIRSNRSELEIEGGGVIRALPSTEDAGRGFTASLVIVDEAAFHAFAEENYRAYYPTVADGGQLITSSTSDGPQGWFYRHFQDSDHKVFIPWFARPDRDEEWRVATLRRLGQDDFMREYPSSIDEAFAASTGLVFEFDPQRHLRPDHPVPWSECIVRIAGVDPGGSDPTAVVILGGYRRADGIHWHQYDELYRSGAVSTDDMISFMFQWNVQLCVGDFGDKSPYAETFRRHGLEAHGAKKDRGAQYRKHAEVLNHNRLTIHSSAASAKEYYSYWWDPKSSTPFATRTGEGHHADGIQAREYAILFAEQAWERGVLRQSTKVGFTRGEVHQPRRAPAPAKRRAGKKAYR